MSCNLKQIKIRIDFISNINNRIREKNVHEIIYIFYVTQINESETIITLSCMIFFSSNFI